MIGRHSKRKHPLTEKLLHYWLCLFCGVEVEREDREKLQRFIENHYCTPLTTRR